MPRPTGLVELAAAPSEPREVRVGAANRWSRRRIRGIKPEGLSSIITSAEEGRVEDWADLANFMLRDPDVRSVYETRTLAITSASFELDPGEGDGALGDEAADFIRGSFEQCSEFESILTGLVHAEGVGWALGQHNWSRRDGGWHSEPSMVEPRDVRFSPDWTLQVRSYDDERRAIGRWHDLTEYPRNSFIPHVPTKLDRPTVSGDLMAVAWTWLFKRWSELFRQEGLEKFASPFITGKVPPNAPAAVRDALQTALEALSADQIAVLEEGTSIEYQETSSRPGDAWTEAISALTRTMTKCLLGSDLNTEVGSSGGNRALGESQFSTTILPRLMAMAKRLAATILRNWITPTLELNMHLFGGRMPPLPTLRFVLINDEPAEVDELVVNAGAVTVDELRLSKGLEPWGKERGGDRVVTPIAKTQPAFERSEPAVEVAATVPFGRGQMPLPLTSRRKTSPTRSASPTRTEFVPFD